MAVNQSKHIASPAMSCGNLVNWDFEHSNAGARELSIIVISDTVGG